MARISYNRRWNIASDWKLQNRGSPGYETRLHKYYTRGFSVIDVNLSRMMKDMNFSFQSLVEKYSKLYLEYMKSKEEGELVCIPQEFYGIILFLIAIANPNIWDNFQDRSPLKFGPNYTLLSLEQLIQEDRKKDSDQMSDSYGSAKALFKIITIVGRNTTIFNESDLTTPQKVTWYSDSIFK